MYRDLETSLVCSPLNSFDLRKLRISKHFRFNSGFVCSVFPLVSYLTVHSPGPKEEGQGWGAVTPTLWNFHSCRTSDPGKEGCGGHPHPLWLLSHSDSQADWLSASPRPSGDQSSPQENLSGKKQAAESWARQERPVNMCVTHLQTCSAGDCVKEAEETIQDGGGALEGLGQGRPPVKQSRGGQAICVNKHKKGRSS